MRSWSLRARLTLVATALLGAGLAVAGALLGTTVAHSLRAALDAGALQSGREVAALVDTGRLPDPLPVGGAATAVIQVVDAQDRVLAASAGGDRLVGLLRPDELSRARAGTRLSIDGSRASLDGPLRVVAVPAGSPGDPLTVVVAVGSASVQESVRLLHTALLLGVPVLLGLLALVSWRVIGWTLRPVEALRRGAEEITGVGGSRRLPLPMARDEVRRLAATLNDMLARLDAASARQRAFVSDAAHELRSPLASIRTQLEVAVRLAELNDSPVTARSASRAARTSLRPAVPAESEGSSGASGPVEVAELAHGVLLDVERLSRLVDDLLLLARLDEAAPSQVLRRREPVDLGVLVKELAERYDGVRVPVRVGPGGADSAAVVVGDPEGLRRVLANLLDNAVRHATTAVTVDLDRSGDVAELAVTDDGPGIPVADRERVFDRFTRLDSGRGRDDGGAGLGLAIVRDLVRTHGGTVTLQDAAPGTRAVVALPAETVALPPQ
jgi:signal transduction histidine kinase